MGLLDIIVLVLVLVAVVTRFTKFKLPTDTRDRTARRADMERLRGRPLVRDDQPEPVDVTAEAEVARVPVPRKPTLKETMEATKNLTGMAKIKALEPGFDEAAFLEGAKGAYSHFYSCWNAKDEQGLDSLCAPALYGRLMNELQGADWQPVQVDDIADAKVTAARVHGKTAVIDVDFTVVEREGKSAPKTVKRGWVLARPLGSDDPNWELQDIKNSADA